MKKFLLLVIAAVLVLVLAAAVWLWQLDPNDYKDRISQQVEQTTGRSFSIDGPIEWSLFPWLAMELNQVSLGNPSGFPDRPMLTAALVSGSVKLLPLLGGETRFGDISVSDAQLELITNRSGVSNLDDLMTSSGSESDGNADETGDGAGLSTGAITLNDVDIRMLDQRTGSDQLLAIQRLALDGFSLGEPHGLQVVGRLAQGAAGEAAREDLLSEFRLDSEITWPRDEAEAIRLDGMAFEAISPSLAKPLAVSGDMSLATAPAYRARLEQGSVTLGDNTLDTDFTLELADRPRLDFTLRGERLDLDALGAVATESGEVSGGDAGGETDLSWLETLELNGELTLAELLAGGLTLEDVSASLMSRRGTLNVDPLSASLYGGEFQGSASLTTDETGRARWRLRPRLQDVDLGSLLTEFLPEPLIDARGDLNLDVSAAGLSPAELLASVAGSGDYQLRDGRLMGLDANALLSELAAITDWRSLLDTSLGAAFSGNTPFQAMAGQLRFTDGQLQTPDVRLQAEQFEFLADGAIGLGNFGVDYDLSLQPKGELQQRLAARSDTLSDGIPLSVSGNMANPSIRLDFQDVARSALQQRASEALLERLTDDDEAAADDATADAAPGESAADGAQSDAEEEDRLSKQLGRGLLERLSGADAADDASAGEEASGGEPDSP